MSRVYDALQQCIPAAVNPSRLDQNDAVALFSQQFADSTWDLEGIPILPANLSSEDKVPVMFSTYSLASEQFRLLATRLRQMRESRTLKSILVTSSVGEEGKSLLTLNLALSLAHGARQKVLVVDADLRKPGVCRALRVEECKGIREWYRTDQVISDFLRRVAGVHVWVLPAGLEEVDPVEILSSSRMAGLLTTLSTAFDWVLIDSCPLLPMADAGIMSRLSDATLMVVRRNKTAKTALKEALERVDPTKMLGFLLNDFPTVSHYSYERYGKAVNRQASSQSAA